MWYLTTRDMKNVRGYFDRGCVDMPIENWLRYSRSCEGAAMEVGFRGAYCTVYEKDPCVELFGKDKMRKSPVNGISSCYAPFCFRAGRRVSSSASLRRCYRCPVP